jgi:hypothetical protein
MDQDRDPPPLAPPAGTAVHPLIRPVEIVPDQPAGSRFAPVLHALRHPRTRLAGTVALGLLVGTVPGLVLAAGARMEAAAAERRAEAAERTMRMWQLQAAEGRGAAGTAAGTTKAGTTTGGTAAGGTAGGAARGAQVDAGTAGALAPSVPARDKRAPGNGIFRVGKDIEIGVWRSRGNNGCHWERVRANRSGKPIIVGFGNPVGTGTVTIRASDVLFKSEGCNDWFKTG